MRSDLDSFDSALEETAASENDSSSSGRGFSSSSSDDEPSTSLWTLMLQRPAGASRGSDQGPVAAVDRGSGPDPGAVLVRRGRGAEPVVMSRDNFVPCCICVEDGTGLEHVAEDIGTLKAAITIVITKDGFVHPRDLEELLQNPDVFKRGDRPIENGLHARKYRVGNRVYYNFGTYLLFGRFGALFNVYRDVEFPLPCKTGFLIVDNFLFEWTVCGTNLLRVATLNYSAPPIGKHKPISWDFFARELCWRQVRILVGRYDNGKSSPLLTALSCIVATHIIEPAHGSDFFIAVLGEVQTLTWQQGNVHATSGYVSPFPVLPETIRVGFESATTHTDKIRKGIISLTLF